MTQLLDDVDLDSDFSDLDEIIADAEAERAEKQALAGKRKKLAGKLSEDDRLRLTAEIRASEDRFIWQTEAAVALFESQHCLSCGHDHRFFIGWMNYQQHKTDPNCRRYLRGRPEGVPSRTETHARPDVELCGDCAEACITIEGLVGAVNADIEKRQQIAARAAEQDRRDFAEAEAERIRQSATIDPLTGKPYEIHSRPELPVHPSSEDGSAEDISQDSPRERCPHGEAVDECNDCYIDADFAYDAARERR